MGDALRHFDQSGAQVHQVSDGGVYGPFGDDARQAGDEGHADGAFVVVAFSPAAVVAGHFYVLGTVDNHGVFDQAGLF